MKRSVFILLSVLLASSFAKAETSEKQGYFNHVDLGLTLGSTGVGVDVAMPVGDYLRVRTGFTYMPHFKLNSSFDLGTSVETKYKPEETVGNMTHFLSSITSLPVDNKVDMKMEPTYNQFKFLVDVMPFHNKHWNFTVGFYVGPSRVGKAYNKTEDAPTLMGIAMYNGIYKHICRQEPVLSDADGNPLHYDLTEPDKDEDLPTFQLSPEQSALFTKRGIIGMPLGTFKDGSKAMMVPDENGMVTAVAKVNKFRPYLGVGYTTDLSKDRKWKLAVDAGVLFWGGSPQVYVDNVYKINSSAIDADNEQYDIIRKYPDWKDRMNAYYDANPDAEDCPKSVVYQTDEALQHVSMTDDLQNISGKVGDMLKTMKKFKVYPNVGVTFSYRLF